MITRTAVLAAVALILAACGGGDESRLTLEEYLNALDRTETIAEAAWDRAVDDFEGVAARSEEETEVVDAFGELLNQLISGIERNRDEVRGLVPPSEIERFHDEALDAQADVLVLVLGFKAKAELAQSELDVEEIGGQLSTMSESSAEVERLQSAICAIQTLGNERGFDVYDIGCSTDWTAERRLELQAYLTEVDARMDIDDRALKAFEEAFRSTPRDSEEELAETFRTAYAFFGDTLRGISDDLAALVPPRVAEDAHANLLDAINAGVDALDGASQQDLESEGGLLAALALIDEVAGSPAEACRRLQRVVDNRDVSFGIEIPGIESPSLTCDPLGRDSPEEDWTIVSFDAEYSILPDGNVDVIEDIVVDFGTLERHGIFRDIPVEYKYDDENNRLISITEASADDGIDAIPLETSQEDGYIRLKVGDPDVLITGEQRYRISYSIRNGLNPFAEHDELFWNVTGDGWAVVIESASAAVELPGPGLLAVDCFQGPTGSTDPCTTFSSDSAATFRATGPLAPGSGLTFVVSIENDLIDVSPPVIVDADSE